MAIEVMKKSKYVFQTYFWFEVSFLMVSLQEFCENLVTALVLASQLHNYVTVNNLNIAPDLASE